MKSKAERLAEAQAELNKTRAERGKVWAEWKKATANRHKEKSP